MKKQSINIGPGTRVCTLRGETDNDHNDVERKTPTGTWGYISSLNHADHWDVLFPNGAWVVITEAELRDTSQYMLGEPGDLREHLLALQYGQDVLEHTLLDDEMMGHTEFVAGNPDHALDLIKQLHECMADALEMRAVIERAWNRWDRADQADNPTLGDDLERICSSTPAWAK